jgi:hypothetical protein
MTNHEAVDGAELTREKSSTDTGTAMLKVEELNSTSEISNSRNPATQPEDKPKEKICGVCSDHEARYKCSRCQLP